MKRIRTGAESLIKELRYEEYLIEIADEIIQGRVEKGIDKIPYDIFTVLDAVKREAKSFPFELPSGLYLIMTQPEYKF
jgi:hypothetical protein